MVRETRDDSTGEPPTSVHTEIPSAAAKSPTAAHHRTRCSQLPPPGADINRSVTLVPSTDTLHVWLSRRRLTGSNDSSRPLREFALFEAGEELPNAPSRHCGTDSVSPKQGGPHSPR